MGGRGPAGTPSTPQGPLDLLKEDSSYGLRILWGREDPLWAWWKEGGSSPPPRASSASLAREYCLTGSVVGGIMAPHNVLVLITRTCDCVTSRGQRGFADVIELRV